MKNETASIKIRRDFSVWLKTRAAERGAFVYELLEEFAARQMGGQKPWRPKEGKDPRRPP